MSQKVHNRIAGERGCNRFIFATLLREQGETGVQSHMRVFKDFLEGKGREVQVVTPFDNPRPFVYPVFALRRCIDPLNGPLSVWWYRYWHHCYVKMALRRVLADGRPQIIYAQDPLSAKAALEVRAGGQQSVVLVVHFNVSQAVEWAEKEKIRKNGALFDSIRRMEKEVLPALDGIVFVSRFMRESLEEEIPAIRDLPIAVIPNFCASHTTSAIAERQDDLVSIGTLEPRKNQKFLLYIVAAALRQGTRLTLTLIGDGPDRSFLESLSNSLGIQEQVRFVGYRSDAVSILSKHRVYVHSAFMENLPMAIIEALACGLPVAAAPVGGIKEIFSHEVEGIYWNLDDPDSAAVALNGMLKNKEHYNAMSDAAYKRFCSNFSVDRVAADLEDFLNKFQHNY